VLADNFADVTFSGGDPMFQPANWGYVSAVCEQSFRIKGYCLRIYVYFFAIAFSSAYPPNH
ncbi:hypothetical protein POY58_14115, partial [Bacteroides uniformis]|nr:hypothetical protein [Bacteroides uniformis]